MLRPQNASDPRVIKGIQDADTLKSEFIHALLESSNGKVFVENDLRAYCNPTRRLMIEQATEDLARKLLSLCPACQMPGYWKIKSAPDLTFSAGNSPARESAYEIWQCQHCQCTNRQATSQTPETDSKVCDNSNP